MVLLRLIQLLVTVFIPFIQKKKGSFELATCI
jgi:hypothetical protein